MAKRKQPDDPGLSSDDEWNMDEARASFAALPVWTRVLLWSVAGCIGFGLVVSIGKALF